MVSNIHFTMEKGIESAVAHKMYVIFTIVMNSNIHAILYIITVSKALVSVTGASIGVLCMK